MSLDLRLELPVDTGNKPFKAELYDGNITHNLGKMARECGLYEPMWRPYLVVGLDIEEEDEVVINAGVLIKDLRRGIEELENNKEEYIQYNPDNGWGDYDGLLRVAKEYLTACEDYPHAVVKAWR